jgi:hypothetical protein
MPFIHPAILWTGLGAVSVPVLVHLLNRRRFRIRDWAAMRFLLESLRKNRRRLRIEELILLALRCLIILLLAVTLARFTGCAALDFLPAGETRQTVVFLLDDSYSMSQTAGGRTVFEAAKAELIRQLRTMPKTYTVAVVRTSDPDPNGRLYDPSVLDVESLAESLALLEPSDRRADLGRSLAAAETVFNRAESGSPKRLILLSDFRRVDLSGADRSAVRKHFQALRGMDVEVVAADYGRAPQGNLTLAGIELQQKYPVVNAPCRVRIAVRNHGPVQAQDVRLALAARRRAGEELVDAALPVEQIAQVPPDGEPNVTEYTFTPTAPGPMVLTARLPADEVSADNVAHLALDVREAMRVLVVDGRPDLADPTACESFFFLRAVDPTHDGAYGVRPDVITYDGLRSVEFDAYDVVVLMNLSSFPMAAGPPASGPAPAPDRPAAEDEKVAALYPQLDALKRYVRAGGGLAIFTGDRVDPRFYNRYLWAQGKGLCPFRILRRAGSPTNRRQYVTLDPKSLDTGGVLRKFRGERSAVAALIRFFAFTQVHAIAPPAEGDAKPPRILARFTDPDHSPAIVTRRYGKGTVLMVYSTASRRWNDWPTDPTDSYLLVMTDLLDHLARPAPPRTAQVGAPIILPLPAARRHATAVLRTPAYPRADEVRLAPQVLAGDDPNAAPRRALRYPRADHAGVYRLSLESPGQADEVLFARNVDPDEGDLTHPGSKSALAAAFGSEEFTYRLVQAPGAAGDMRARAGREYWPWVVGALLALMALEVFLAQRFGHYGEAKNSAAPG